MKTYIIFSKNNKIGSKIISYFSGLLIRDLEKVPSHVSILLDFGDHSFIIESVLGSGVRIVPYDAWLKINEVCYIIDHNKPKSVSNTLSIVSSMWSKKYDWFGISFFIIAFLNHLIFKQPFPKHNKFQKDDMYFCTEAAAKLVGYDKHGMTTPAKMCSDLLAGKYG